MTNCTKVAVAVAGAMIVASCGTSASDLPLPGSSLSGDSYTITAELDDALNLADGAPVKLNGVDVGRVDAVTAHNFTARITMSVRETTPLHADATIRLRSTTPLGELFVELSAGGKGALLDDGDAIQADAASAEPTVEDTLASASMLINGGGIGQVQTIVREVNEALGGREGTARDLLDTLNVTTRTLNDSSADIDATLEALADVSEVLRRRQATIDQALIDVQPAARVLSNHTEDLGRLLHAVDQLGGTTTRIVGQTRADLLTTLQELGPVLDQFVTLEDEFGPGLTRLVIFAQAIDRAVPGDYLNVHLFFQDSLSVGLPNLPVVGDLGGDQLEISPDLLEVPEFDSFQELLDPKPEASDAGLSGLLELLGGGR